MGCFVLDEREHVVGGLAEVLVGGYCWEWDVVWEPVDGQSVAYAEGAGDVALVTAVMFDGWADIPAVDAVWTHVRTLGWREVNDDASAWWGKGTLVEIEVAVEASVGRKVGLATGRA